ncbi:TIM23 complex component [Coemansia aciculifera]|uniref:Presequence translocated-associated motor subunit PAM17 n=2 Tax=Coemansia TaxID=4863 RepID=A0A9W8IF51_9FUNG|nr:TIM23 complex component [Coemansia aciculifera]KAJ2871799.1 TIM23 complex component [Coemansia aciculifera]
MLGLMSSGPLGGRLHMSLTRAMFAHTRRLQTATEPALNWEEFFTLRKQRRLWERLAALPCAMLGLGAGAAVFASLPVNPQQTFMGFDPLIVFGGATMFCGVLGFVGGPSVGRIWYRMGNRRLAQSLDLKEAEFFRHVKSNRSDPVFSSASNPLPDFYGEKINSLSAYRKWLRKQREHERKGTFNLGNKKK